MIVPPDDQRSRPRKWVTGLAICAIFVLVSCLFFRKILFAPTEYHIPYDIGEYHYPLAYEIYDGLKDWRLPLWDPYVYTGMPLAGNINAQVFYPPTLIAVKLSDWTFGDFPYRALEYQLVFHFILAACLAYLLARSFKVGRAPAVLCGIVYAFGGFFASQMQHLGLLDGAAWIPLVFYLLKRSIEEKRLFLAAATGVALSMAILAGFPALFFLTMIVTALVCVVMIAWYLWQRDVRHARFVAAVLLITFVTSIGLSAVQLLPAAELDKHSIAAELHENAGLGHIPSEAYLTIVLPRAFSVGITHYWAGIDQTQMYMYLGIAPLILGILCLLRPSRLSLLVLSVALFCLIWAMSDAFDLASWIWLILPPQIKGGVYNYYAWVFLELGVALLAAFGLDRLSEAPALRQSLLPPTRGLLKVVVFFALALLLVSFLIHAQMAGTEYGTPERARLVDISQTINIVVLLLLLVSAVIYWRAFGHLGGRATSVALVVITALDLISFGAGTDFNTYKASADGLSANSWSGNPYPINVIKSDPDFHAGKFARIDIISRGGRAWHTACRLWGIQNSNGDDPLLLKDYYFYRMRDGGTDGSRRFITNDGSSKLLDLVGVKHMVVYEGNAFTPPPGARLVADGPIRVWERPRFLPRAFLVGQAEFVDNTAAALDKLTAPGFSPEERVILVRPKGRRGIPASSGTPAEPSVGVARIESYHPNRVRLTTEAEKPAYLVLVDAFFPGWKATVDGKESTIFKAYGVFRAIEVPAGKHEIVFKYRPRSVYLGAVITLLTLLALGVGWLWSVRAERRKAPTAPPIANSLAKQTDESESFT